MRVLFLVQDEQRVILDSFYQAIADHCDCDLRRLSSAEQANLRRYFKEYVDVSRYERIILFLRFKKQIRQVTFIRTLPNLIELEHDAYQNYIPCKYTGAFSRYYRRMPWVRVLSSGAHVTERLCAEGVDTVFVPKGYDSTLLWDMALERDIELGFVGSLKSSAYDGRRRLLEELAQHENLLITRTKSGDEYRQMLNRIRYFISADVGMGEYMIKNFEAMACGCVLFAFDQGASENAALGFEDMKHLVLYRSVEELREKLAVLRANPALAAEIAAVGKALVEERYSFQALGQRIVEEIGRPLRPRAQDGWLKRALERIGL